VNHRNAERLAATERRLRVLDERVEADVRTGAGDQPPAD